jgi:hypothetical protein
MQMQCYCREKANAYLGLQVIGLTLEKAEVRARVVATRMRGRKDIMVGSLATDNRTSKHKKQHKRAQLKVFRSRSVCGPANGDFQFAADVSNDEESVPQKTHHDQRTLVEIK